MASSIDPVQPSKPRGLSSFWPWLLLGFMTLPAVWHVLYFYSDVDPEFPRVARPTFSPLPPPSYRLAEPGDTIDRIAIYVSSLAIVLVLTGLVRTRGRSRLWYAALALSVAAFWQAANPGPTFDGWHGLGWRAMLNPAAPAALRLSLLGGAAGLASVVAWGVGFRFRELWREGRGKGVAWLLTTAGVLALLMQVKLPRVEPVGYWERWAFVWSLVALCAALVRILQSQNRVSRRLVVVAASIGGTVVWTGLVFAGIGLTWYHRPIDRLREVAPGKVFMCAMPTAKGLEIAHARHQFKTIINLFPEDTPYRSPLLPQELKFAKEHGIRYVGSPAGVTGSNDFLDLTLQLARDPDAWPILVHCHACMDRTPAWVGIYKFVVEGRPLDEILRFIEDHRGYRPKASVTLLYNRVLPRLAPDHYRDDPTAPLLRQCAEGTVDPYFEQLQAALAKANRDRLRGVGAETRTAQAERLPSLTPRR